MPPHGRTSLPDGGPSRRLGRAVLGVAASLTLAWAQPAGSHPGRWPGTLTFAPNPEREWTKARMDQAAAWLRAPAPDPLDRSAWGIALVEGGWNSPTRCLWIRRMPDGGVQVRLRTPLLDLDDQLERLHARHPGEGMGALCARLALVDVEIPAHRLRDLGLEGIGAALAALAPPDPASLEGMERPCDGWWEWRVVSARPRKAYGKGGYVQALAGAIRPGWAPPPEEDGTPAKGMSLNEDMNLVVAWTSALAWRCEQILMEDQARISYGGLLTREGLADLGPEWLAHALASGDTRLVKALLARGVDPGALDLDGRLPLNVAAGHPVHLRMLLEAGADPKAVDRFLRTPLMWAAEQGSVEGVQLLLDRGCPVAARDHFERTALDWALPDPASEDSAYRDRLEAIATLLLAHGTPARNRDCKGDSTLAKARRLGRPGIVRRLLEAGARDEEPPPTPP